MPGIGGRETACSTGSATQRGLEVPTENQSRDHPAETGSLIGPCLLHLAQPRVTWAGTGALEMMSRLSGVAETSRGEGDVKYFPSPKVLCFLNVTVFSGWLGLSWGERGCLAIAAGPQSFEELAGRASG